MYPRYMQMHDPTEQGITLDAAMGFHAMADFSTAYVVLEDNWARRTAASKRSALH